MAEAGRPGGSTPLAADDMIGSLATRVRELSLRVAQLEGELEAARRRVAVYEDFDAQVQDSLSAALRASNQIRERARVTAEAIAEEARAQRPAAVAELDAMRIERDALRRAIDDASSSVTPRAAAPMVTSFPMSEMRLAAADALRGVFKELVAEIRAATPPPAAVVQVAPAVQTPAAPPPRPANSPAASAPPQIYQAPPAQQPASAAPPPTSSITPPPAPQSWQAPVLPAPAPYSSPPSSYNAPVPEPLPRPTVVPPQERREPAPLVEDVDVDVAPAAAAPAPAPVAPPPAPAPIAPAPVAAAPAPQAAPAPAAAEPAREWVAAPGEPIGEVQVVLSPISSFPRLVELERRLQGMPVVRTVYARDFRNGVATLAIGLRHPMTVDEFATAVTKLEYPRLRIVSTSGYVLELRIDSEASSIA